MAYNPTNWKRGDVVTSEKLNNIETGITGIESSIPEASSVKILNIEVSEDNGTTSDGETIYTVTVVHKDFDADALFTEINEYLSGDKSTAFPAFAAFVQIPEIDGAQGWSVLIPMYYRQDNDLHKDTLIGIVNSTTVRAYTGYANAVNQIYTVQIDMSWSAEHATVSVYHSTRFCKLELSSS